MKFWEGRHLLDLAVLLEFKEEEVLAGSVPTCAVEAKFAQLLFKLLQISTPTLYLSNLQNAPAAQKPNLGVSSVDGIYISSI